MQDVSQCPLVSLTIVIVLGVTRLHLPFHVFEEFVTPLLSLLCTAPRGCAGTIGNQSPHSLEVSILLNLFLLGFSLLDHSAPHSLQILLMPPFPILLLRVLLLLTIHFSLLILSIAFLVIGH